VTGQHRAGRRTSVRGVEPGTSPDGVLTILVSRLDAPVLRWLPGVLGGILVLIALVLAGVHLHDRFEINHTSGVWLGLAQAFRRGSLYLPLHAGDRYGGGRYMPLGVLLDGGLSKIVHNELVGSKIVSLVVAAALFTVVLRVCERLGCDRRLSVGVAALPFATSVGLEQLAGVRNDTLPVLLALAGVAVAWRSVRRGAPIASGVLAGLAFVAKTTSVWALPVVVWWWWRRAGRATALRAAVAGVVAPAVVLVVCSSASNGRLASSVFGVRSWWPPHLLGLLTALGQDQLEMVLAIVPFVVIALVVVMLPRALTGTPFVASLLLATAITVPLFFDSGSAANHLLDIAVLAPIVGAVAVREAEPVGGMFLGVLRVATCVGLVLGLAGVYAFPLLHRGGQPGWHAFAAEVRPGEPILSEDASVPVSLGEQPQVLDAFALRVLAEHDPHAVQPLVDEITHHRFGEIFLVLRPESDTTNWYHVIQFGPTITTAIVSNYHFDHVTAGLNVYVPDPPR